MIRVKKIEICEFRGIRSLNIDFKDQNFAVCGRNGTGKSGIVDALEFGLTGNISRLSGEGMGNVSLKEHAPHVDSRNDPEKAKVVLTLLIPSLNKEVVIERSVKESSSPKITPNDPEILKVLEEVSLHPEFALSRRELIRYVISTPGNRATEVQALLKLEKIENIRKVLQKIANAAKKEVAPLEREKDSATNQLILSLGITELASQKLLGAVNAKRKILGLEEIEKLTPTTSIKDGLVVAGSKVTRIPKVQACADIQRIEEIISDISSKETAASMLTIKENLEALSLDPAMLAGVTRENFLKTAIQMVESEACPVCDTEWDPGELKSHVESKLKTFEDAAKRRKELQTEVNPFADKLGDLHVALSSIENYGTLLTPAIDMQPVKDFKKVVLQKKISLQMLTPITGAVATIETYSSIPDPVKTTLENIKTAILAIPDPSDQDAARDYLTVGQERLEAYRGVSLRCRQAVSHADTSASVLNTYAEVTTQALNDIYKEVESDFTELYRLVNQDDEGDFTAQLTPSTGKLGFDVNFYGRGYFPPGAYHSEGHQDGMGLCLYLALMKHLLGDSFTFAVLDDVLMSVDSGHRREVCSMLKEKFPNTQFILTTHDEVWLKHMKTAGLIEPGASMIFRKWDVDNGPTEWNDRDVWNEIEEDLKNNNVRSAAGILRHYLEFVSSEICHRLRAKVEFRGDAQFQLGDLLPSATSAFSKLLLEAEKAAASWGQTSEAEQIRNKRSEFDTLVAQSQLEQWQTNSAIHFNGWANLDTKDFTPVVEVFHKLVDSFFCSEGNCKSLFRVVPERGEKEMLKCSCGKVSMNLKKK